MRKHQLAAMLVLSLALVAPTGASAAKVVSGKVYEKKLKKLYRARLSTINVTAVRCPARVTVKVGYRFTCAMTLTTGDRSPLKVRIRNRGGDITVTMVDMAMRELEEHLGISLSEDNLSGIVTCPAARKVRAGDKFTCDVEFSNGARGVFDCVQIGDGRVTFSWRVTSGDPGGVPPPPGT